MYEMWNRSNEGRVEAEIAANRRTSRSELRSSSTDVHPPVDVPAPSIERDLAIDLFHASACFQQRIINVTMLPFFIQNQLRVQ